MEVSDSSRLDSYRAIAFLVLGAFILVAVLLSKKTVNKPFENTSTADPVQLQRIQAIEQAKHEGKTQYSFTVQKAPMPVSP
jgi:hypothetical protein